jgi:hypothetical protein
MNVLGAIVAALAGTAVFTMVMLLAPRMGMPKMDIVGLLGSMFGRENRALGWVMHVMMGIVFGLIYAFLWSIGIGAPTWLGGLVFGAAQWLVVGLIMGLMIPLMHAGIRSGKVMAPGYWMTNAGGVLAFVGGLMGHMIFGLVIALVYARF